MDQVQVLEFSYDAVNVDDIEASINAFLGQHDVEEVKITQWEDQLLVFFLYDE
jgi:hypothetical protein